MRTSTPVTYLIVAAAAAMIAGCTNNVAVSSNPLASRMPAHPLMTRLPVAMSRYGMLRVNPNAVYHFTSFDNCPTIGQIAYISDFTNSVVNIYAGKFANQAPCGRLSGNGVALPEGMFVEAATHDLYVANTGGFDIVVFHRGAAAPYKTFTDPSGQYPVDVTVASDGTVIASNTYATNGGQNGSISTWKHSGSFVGNFPMVNDVLGAFVTVQKNGTLYFNDVDQRSGAGLLWTGSCPLGACGRFTSTGATTIFPGGLRSADSEDVVQIDQKGALGGTLITYERFPIGLGCAIGGGEPDGMDLNKSQHDVFYADAANDVGTEIQYPTCAPVGSVPGNLGGLLIGAAVDVPGGLH